MGVVIHVILLSTVRCGHQTPQLPKFRSLGGLRNVNFAHSLVKQLIKFHNACMSRMNKIQLNAEFEEKQNAALTPVQKLTKTQIIELIEKARLHLTKDVQCMGMTTKHSDFNCKINPTSSKRVFLL